MLQQQATLMSSVQAMAARPIQVTSSTSARSWDREPKVSGPSPFSGKKNETKEFIAKCETVFAVQPRTYSSDISQIAFASNLLKDEAYQWILPHLEKEEEDRPIFLESWGFFKQEFLKIFGDSDIIETSRQKLKSLRQTKSVTSYSTEFTRYSAYLHWGDEALRHAYFDGLKEDVKDKLLTPNEFASLADLVDASIKWDNLLYQRRRSVVPRAFAQTSTIVTQSRQTVPPSRPVSTTHVPMEIDAVQPRFSPLTPEEREHRFKNKLCMYCGKPGHVAKDCRAKQNKPARINAIDQPKNDQPQA
ncbi:hypothetical protein P7C73_g6615, partial [Tremellales sp. Uapishka_1]